MAEVKNAHMAYDCLETTDGTSNSISCKYLPIRLSGLEEGE